MPYCARKHQLQNTLVYHVYNRSNGRKTVFHCDNDYLNFTALIKEYADRFSAKTYHWTIMPNHYHLLLEIEEPKELSKLMAGLQRSYTCYYHKIYSTAGFLWQGRFKLQPVEKERYLIACGRYIERNPVRAKIVVEAKDYLHSSAKFYCLGKIDGVSKEDPSFREFGEEINQRRNHYNEFLRDFDTEEEKLFANIEEPQGSEEFTRRLIIHNGRYIPKRRGRPKKRIVL